MVDEEVVIIVSPEERLGGLSVYLAFGSWVGARSVLNIGIGGRFGVSSLVLLVLSILMLGVSGIILLVPVGESAPQPFDILSPADGATTSTTPTLTWEPAGQAMITYLDFDGVDDYVSCGSGSSLDVNSALTLSAWVRADTLAPAVDPDWTDCILGKTMSDGTAGDYRLSMNADSISFMIHNGVDRQFCRYSTTPQTGTWYHIVGTWDGATMTTYVDGVSRATLAMTGSLPSGTPNFQIGRMGAPGYEYQFDGAIRDVRVYNRALSASEVSDLYNGAAVSSTGLAGHWMFDEGSGTTAADSSGNSNNGTVNGATWGFEGDSGIDHYEVYIDGVHVGNTSSTSYTVPSLSTGSHTWYVIADDGSGGRVRSTSTFTFTVEEVSRILVTGDPHMWQDFGIDPATFGAHINNLDEKYPLDFVVEAGDLSIDQAVYDGNDFISTVTGTDVPFFHIMGDHDGVGWEEWVDRTSAPPRSYYYLKDGILHIFINDPVSTGTAGTYTEGTRYFLKYLLEHKYPDKTTFIYSHYGVFGYGSQHKVMVDGHRIGVGEVRNSKFSNYQDVEWWENLFINNPQIKVWFQGHVHRNIYDPDCWTLKNGVLNVALESWATNVNGGEYVNVFASGPTRDFPLVTISKDNIRLVPYNLDREQIELSPSEPGEDGETQDWTLPGPTSFDPTAEDEYGVMRTFLDGRTILNYNHVVGTGRKIEIFRPNDTNLLPDPEFQNTAHRQGAHDGWVPAVAPFWMAEGDFNESNTSWADDIITFTNTKGIIGTRKTGFPPEPWTVTTQKFMHNMGTYPPAAEGLELEMTARIYSDSSYNNGLTLRLYFQTDEIVPDYWATGWDSGHTNVKIAEQTLNLSPGWNTYSLIATAPTNVTNPDFPVPRLRVEPEIEWTQTGTYRIDWVRIRPTVEGATSNLLNPSLNIDGANFNTSASLGAWESVIIDAPIQNPLETIQMSGSGGKMGIMILQVTNPMIQTWGRPIKFGNGRIIAGASRSFGTQPEDIYMKSLEGTFTVGSNWTESAERAPNLMLSNISTEQSLGMWDLTTESSGRVDISNLQTETTPVENITWTATSTASDVTFTVGDLVEGTNYSIYVDGSKIGERVANSWGEISFTYSSWSIHTFSVSRTAGGGDVTPPAPFALVSPMDGENVGPTVSISWQASSDTSGIDRYEVWLDDTNIGNTTNTSYVLTSLADGQHTWYIVAYDTVGNSRQSTGTWTFTVASDDTTPPDAFDLLTPADGENVGSVVSLAWEASSDVESGVNHYEVWLDGTNVDNVLGGVTDFTTPTLTAGVHSWYIRVVNGVGLATQSTSTFDFVVVDDWSPELGDVDGNGAINIVDALQVARYDAQLSPSPFYPEVADVDCNTAIDIVDALQIARYDAGLVGQFSC